MFKRTSACLAIGLLAFLLLTGCEDKVEEVELPIQLIAENSFFSDFEIDEKSETVIIDCYLTFRNDTTDDQNFAVAADFQVDEDGGLLDEGKLYGTIRETGADTFCLAAGETKGDYIRFIGDHGGSPMKANRNLPEEITIQVGEDEYSWDRQEDGSFVLIE